MSRAIFRRASIDRLRAAVPFRGMLVSVIHSPSRKADAHELTHRGTLVSVASGFVGHVIVLRQDDHMIDTVLPLSQVRSITAVTR